MGGFLCSQKLMVPRNMKYGRLLDEPLFCRVKFLGEEMSCSLRYGKSMRIQERDFEEPWERSHDPIMLLLCASHAYKQALWLSTAADGCVWDLWQASHLSSRVLGRL